jgi:hypothetical protein
MATVNLSPLFNGQTIFGPTGLPLAGGQIYTYQAGSSTPLATYTTNNGTIPNSNPIILGSDGKLPQELWLQFGYAYKFQVLSSANVLINTYDNISGILTQVPPNPASIPSGCILIWSGSVGSVPTGFVLCDGTNSTPDLRNSFVLGAGNAYSVGQTGGSTDAIVVSHTHTATVTDPSHSHAQTGWTANLGGPNTQGFTNSSAYYVGVDGRNTANSTTGISVSNSTTGVSGTNANMPPYYALCYIMKT